MNWDKISGFRDTDRTRCDVCPQGNPAGKTPVLGHRPTQASEERRELCLRKWEMGAGCRQICRSSPGKEREWRKISEPKLRL